MDYFAFLLAAGSNELIFACALIGALGIGAQWLAWRLQAPAIVLMALAGMAVGPLWAVTLGNPESFMYIGDWFGMHHEGALLNPEKVFNGGGNELLRPIISLAVAVILFEGGLVLKFENLRDAGPAVRRMVFFGGPIAWLLGTMAARFAAGLDWASAVVFAGVMVVTGPTVIMPLLRQSKLGGRTGAALKWEGIVNDPIGALFAVASFEIVRVLSYSGVAGESGSLLGTGAWIILAAALGTALGFAFGWGIVRAFRAGWTPEYLKAPIIFASIILCYAIAELIEKEIGLVAVTAYGMTLANSQLAGINELRKFKEEIAVLAVSGVFVILTANLTPEIIGRALNWRTLFFLVCMLFIVRPLSIWISTHGTLNWQEKTLLGWIAPRGIVAVAVSGLFGNLLVELDRTSKFDFYGADQITPLAFAMVFSTVVLHGFTIGPLAHRLGLARKSKPGVLLVGVNPWTIDLARALKDSDIEPILADNNWRRLRPAREAGLTTFFGEVLSEEAEVRLDHSAFDQVVGMSANEPYNALVCQHFAPELGRHRVFQLSAQESDEEDPRAIGVGTRGQTLIRRGRSYDGLMRDHYGGWQFAKTTLTDKYNLGDLQDDRPKSDWVAEVRPDGTVNLLGPNREARGGEGAIIISFGPAQAKSEIAADKAEKSNKEKESKQVSD